jgi:hypothetical protein
LALGEGGHVVCSRVLRMWAMADLWLLRGVEAFGLCEDFEGVGDGRFMAEEEGE